MQLNCLKIHRSLYLNIRLVFYQIYPMPTGRAGIFPNNGVISLRGSGYCGL